MLTSIMHKYHKFKDRRALIMDVKNVVNELCGYLSGFIIEGKAWLRKVVLDSPVEYIHLVNVKCSHAEYLKSEVKRMEIRIRVDSKNDGLLHTALQDFSTLVKHICDFAKSTINVVPYSKIDEFYKFTYQTHKHILNTITDRYYNQAT